MSAQPLITLDPTPGVADASILASGREDLDPRPGECLACYVDRLLARADCSGTAGLTARWTALRAPRATTLRARLARMGVSCDCEVVTVAYAETESLVVRMAGPWDRPACLRVQQGSSQPCGRWRRRPRWS